MSGWPFILSAFYLTLMVSFTLTLVEHGYGRGVILSHTLRRWGKFLLLLVGLGLIVQVLTAIAS